MRQNAKEKENRMKDQNKVTETLKRAQKETIKQKNETKEKPKLAKLKKIQNQGNQRN